MSPARLYTMCVLLSKMRHAPCCANIFHFKSRRVHTSRTARRIKADQNHISGSKGGKCATCTRQERSERAASHRDENGEGKEVRCEFDNARAVVSLPARWVERVIHNTVAAVEKVVREAAPRMMSSTRPQRTFVFRKRQKDEIHFFRSL